MDFASAPSPRCMYREGRGDVMPCGRPACAIEQRAPWLELDFRCAQHASALAAPLPATGKIRIVRMQLHITIAGAIWGEGPALGEAVIAAAQLVGDLGGRLAVRDARSHVVRAALQPLGSTPAPAAGER